MIEQFMEYNNMNCFISFSQDMNLFVHLVLDRFLSLHFEQVLDRFFLIKQLTKNGKDQR
jgi:hypothetical protein